MSADAVNQTIPAGSTAQWKDKKRYLWLLGLVVPSLAFLAWGLVTLTGWSVFWYLGPIVVFVVIPAIDLLAGLDRSNPPDDVIDALENDKYYRWITYLFLPIQYAALVWACWMFAQDTLGTVEKVGLAMTVGTIAGIGINTAHELGHKKESHERWLAKIALAQSFYGHFYIEHNRGHHVRVATPEDPASSRVGETFYAFWPRTVLGSLRSAWNLEKRRIARRKKHAWTLRNDVLNAWLMSVVLWGALVLAFGIGILPFLLIQAVIGFSLLEVVNYLEHYGMLRQRTGADKTGRYERVDPSHSVEQQQHRDQRAALPPAAAQRPPREPDPALPDPARLRGVAGAAHRLRRPDHPGPGPAAVVRGDGQAGARPLRRRHQPRQHPARQARPHPREVRRARLGGYGVGGGGCMSTPAPHSLRSRRAGDPA